MRGAAAAAKQPPRATLAMAVALAVAAVAVALGSSRVAQAASRRSLTQSAGALPPVDCASVLAKRTVVVFPSLEAPWTGDLVSYLPGGSVDVANGELGMLSLSLPDHQACAQGISDITDTLIIWEDGNLTAAQAWLPRGLVRPSGRLLIVGKDGRDQPGLKDLTFLSRLQQVGGLGVINMDGLVTLRGLESLQRVGGVAGQAGGGSLVVMTNDALVNVTGLDALTRVDNDLIINTNMGLRTLDGLESLVEVGHDLLLKGNGNLLSADALTALERVNGSVALVNNGNHGMTLPPGVAVGPDAAEQTKASPAGTTPPAVADRRVLVIYGGPTPPSLDDVFAATDPFMPPLTKFDVIRQHVRFQPAGKDLTVSLDPDGLLRGHVVIYDGGNITSLSAPFRGVRRVGGSLLVVGGGAMSLADGSPGLTSLADLSNLEAVGELGVVGTTQLRDFKGLSSLGSIDQDLVVMYNAKLESFAGLGEDAGLGAASLASRLASMRGLRQADPSPAASDDGADTQTAPTAAVAAVPVATGADGPGLTRILGEVWIEGNRALTSLAGLEMLREVGWRLSVRSCRVLQSLAALGNLVSVGENLVVLDNDILASSHGLASLQHVGQSVHFLWNQQMADVQGLARLGPVVVGDLVLAGNPLTSLKPLANIKAVGLNLVVARTNASDLSGLDALAQVGGGLSITANSRLTSLGGLGALQRVGDDLSVRDNPTLTSLATMDAALRTVGGGVYVEDNHSLGSLGRLPATLQAAGGNVVVRRNGGNLPQGEVAQLTTKARQPSALGTVVLAPFIRSLLASNLTAGDAVFTGTSDEAQPSLSVASFSGA